MKPRRYGLARNMLVIEPVLNYLPMILGRYEMKQRIIPFVLLAMMLITACTQISEIVQSTLTESSEATEIAVVTEEVDRMQTRINIQVGDRIFTARLLDNPSSQALVAMLPITITMTELNRNEKYYTMSNDLPVNLERVGNINSGDLMLYGSDTLVLFYESFNTSYSYTRLGYVDDTSELANALGKDHVAVTFSLST
jgi:hypothetical protein